MLMSSITQCSCDSLTEVRTSSSPSSPLSVYTLTLSTVAGSDAVKYSTHTYTHTQYTQQTSMHACTLRYLLYVNCAENCYSAWKGAAVSTMQHKYTEKLPCNVWMCSLSWNISQILFINDLTWPSHIHLSPCGDGEQCSPLPNRLCFHPFCRSVGLSAE